ncbi:DNA polymerase subunit Cdc27 [Nemania serpens]|nr:DNA polymerase subunit Cdc27 [Nemania serpens]
MEDYKQYLAQKILTEDQVVTYRLLSRALKVHVNTAKEMLYDFHKWQNDKRPDTLHATYIIYGTRNREVHHQNGDDDGDVDMTNTQTSEDADDTNAPFSDLVPTYTLSLVRQEQLEETLSKYNEVTSVHVYSLAPHPLKDLQLLTDAARQVFQLSTTDDAPKSNKVYGTISNPNVRRRERRAGPIPPKAYAAPPKTESKPPVKQEVKPVEAVAVKEEPKANSKPTASTAFAKKNAPASSLKRQASSGIGQMFAKAAAKPKKPVTKASEPPTARAAASRGKNNQASGTMSDDGEDDTEPMVEVKEEDSTARQARKDRQAELHRMMEESDEEEPEEAAESQEEDPMEEELPPPEPETEPKTEEQAEVVSSTAGGRRRGRRRVTRKKQIMDEKGYLVTIQEQGWESFSEDEAPPPPPPKPKQPQTVKAEPAAKPKKGAAGKGAQGNIMSFFTKK